MTNEKHFPKTKSQWEFNVACLQIYRELLSLTTFLRVHSNSKEVSYLSWQNTYPNLKTACHIALKLFLWTKLLENLLHAKYLISVTAPLEKVKQQGVILSWWCKQPTCKKLGKIKGINESTYIFLKLVQCTRCLGMSRWYCQRWNWTNSKAERGTIVRTGITC